MTRRDWLALLMAGSLTSPLRAGSSELTSLESALAWINSPPLGPKDLRGKVVLVDFWTYTCINWRRTLPWLRRWSEIYRDHGLEIIGVHTPEFGFERDSENVRRAAAEQRVAYPIAIDSDYAIWNAFGNQYWPALYFIDAQGRIRHRQFGEGGYDELEDFIRKLLVEAGPSLPPSPGRVPAGTGAEAAARWTDLHSPETYLGRKRSPGFSPGTPAAQLKLNRWTLQGTWRIPVENASLVESGGRIAYRFHARDVHLVMAPAAQGARVRFRVTLDGKPPEDAAGVDLDAQGLGMLDQPRMYSLIRQTSRVTDRLFEIEFLDAGVEAYVFTFG